MGRWPHRRSNPRYDNRNPVGLSCLIINLGDLVGVSKDQTGRDLRSRWFTSARLPLTTEQMARTPDKFNGRAVCPTGGVIQVLDSGGDDQTFRIDITKNKYDRWDDTVISSYTASRPASPTSLSMTSSISVALLMVPTNTRQSSGPT